MKFNSGLSFKSQKISLQSLPSEELVKARLWLRAHQEIPEQITSNTNQNKSTIPQDHCHSLNKIFPMLSDSSPSGNPPTFTMLPTIILILVKNTAGAHKEPNKKYKNTEEQELRAMLVLL